MITRRISLTTTAISIIGTAAGFPAGAQQPLATKSATAITQVFGDGVKLIAVAVEYAQAIQDTGISSSSFRVDGRTVTAAFPSASTYPADRSASGRFVIVTLSLDDPNASLAQKIDGPKASGPPKGPGPGGPGKAGDISVSDTVYRQPEAVIAQAEPLRTIDGIFIPKSSISLRTTAVRNLVVDDFRQLEFKDARTGRSLAYNLFVPKGYDAARSYPLVVFMHDAGATSNETKTTLFQGLGAVTWANPADQIARPAFVLAPQYGDHRGR